MHAAKWARPNIPHAGEKLDQATIAKREGDNKVGMLNVPRADVDERQDESGQGESRQAQGSWVGELARRRARRTLDLSGLCKGRAYLSNSYR